MNYRIWKYEINPGQIEYKMPYGTKILCAHAQGDNICVWAKVDIDASHFTTRRIVAYGTGHPMDDDPMRYLGTAHLNKNLVFHVFEILEEQ